MSRGKFDYTIVSIRLEMWLIARTLSQFLYYFIFNVCDYSAHPFTVCNRRQNRNKKSHDIKIKQQFHLLNITNLIYFKPTDQIFASDQPNLKLLN